MSQVTFLSLFALSLLILTSIFTNMRMQSAAGGGEVKPFAKGPTVSDSDLKVEVIFKNNGKLHVPTTGMAFLGPNDILVLEKNKGTVQRIIDGKASSHPLLKVDVGVDVEWGMLAIAISKNEQNTNVFLYYTEAADDEDNNGVTRTRLYKYEFVDNRLVNPTLLLDLPAKSLSGPRNDHTAGKVVIDPDKNVYLSIGDVGGRDGQSQNNRNGDLVDGTSGILRVKQDGQPVGVGILGNSSTLRLYYAYGIRNSFGFDFDPVTRNIWDTENGFNDKDEINLVKPGFNSGWNKIMGIAPKGFNSQNFVNFNGNGKYSDPEFVWNQTVGPTDLKFLFSSKLGKQYENTIFVGDFNNGYLYNFKLDSNRTGLLLEGELSDLTADSTEEKQNIIFGKGFGVITDLEVGPDGYLYILGYDGSIYRIVPD